MRWLIVALLVGGCSYSGPCDTVSLSLDDAGGCQKYRDEVAVMLAGVPGGCEGSCEVDCKLKFIGPGPWAGHWAWFKGSLRSGSLALELHLSSNSLLCTSDVSFDLTR